MKGYYEGYSYVGYMPNGKKIRFATEKEYVEAYREALAEQARASLFVCKTPSQHGQCLLQKGVIYMKKSTVWINLIGCVILIALLLVCFFIVGFILFFVNEEKKVSKYSGYCMDEVRKSL